MNFYEEAKKLEKGKYKIIVKGEDFDIELLKGSGRLHICGRDEYFFILEGEGKLLVEDKAYALKEGDGIMIRAGKKHKRLSPNKVCWLLISKHPHKHVFFE